MLITRFTMDGGRIAAQTVVDTGDLDPDCLRTAADVLQQLCAGAPEASVPAAAGSPFVVELGFGHSWLPQAQAVDRDPQIVLGPMAEMLRSLRDRQRNEEADRMEKLLQDLRRHWPGKRPRRHGGHPGPFVTASLLSAARSFTISRGAQRTRYELLARSDAPDDGALRGLIGGMQLRRVRAAGGLPPPLSDEWMRLAEETNREADPACQAILAARPAVVPNGDPIPGSEAFVDCFAACMLERPVPVPGLKPPRRAIRWCHPPRR